MKENEIEFEKVNPEVDSEQEITIYINPTSGFTHFTEYPKVYKVPFVRNETRTQTDLRKSGYEVAENCYVVYPACHTQALYQPPVIIEINSAHPFVFKKKGTDEIYIDREGLEATG